MKEMFNIKQLKYAQILVGNLAFENVTYGKNTFKYYRTNIWMEVATKWN